MHLELIDQNSKVAAIILEDSASLFDSELTVTPTHIKKGYRGYIPWGDDNLTPYTMVSKIRKSDIMSPNMHFNILSAYGDGFKLLTDDQSKPGIDVTTFFKRNNMPNYLLEQITDMKHFIFSICLVSLSKDLKKIVRIKHKEAEHARFEKCNPQTGKIDNVFFANWDNAPSDSTTQVYPLLDTIDPYTDLMVRLGLEPDPTTGRKRSGSKKSIYAILIKYPAPGNKYYPFPPYASHFLSGWYDISAMIPIAKKAKMTNGMSIKYHVEIHKDYFKNIFADENITSQKNKDARKALEFANIKDFLSGIENSGKIWFSGFYIDPNGKETNMVKISLIDTNKEGGDYIEDAEEAGSLQCYSMMVHPSLIGAVPGKNKGSFSGSDKRELFTMKQSMERPLRDLILSPFYLIQEFNKWSDKLIFEIPHLMLTTLDENSDAKKVSNNPKIDEDDN